MKILVTGAAGNLGRALLSQCRGRHEVIGADVVEPPPEVVDADHVQFVKGDVFDEPFFREIAAGCDAICHTAALHGGHLKTHTHEQFIQKNTIGADMMCQAMVALGIGRMAFSSTSEITIGRGWDASGPVIVTDHTPPCPDSVYSLSKLMAEQVYSFHAHKHGLRISCLRYCGFGYIRSDQVGSALVSRYLEASDVAEANLRCLESQSIGFEVFYVAPISPLTGPDLVIACTQPDQIMEKYWPGSIDLLGKAGRSVDDPLWPKLDVTRLRQLTGWAPQHSFDALMTLLRDESGQEDPGQ